MPVMAVVNSRTTRPPTGSDFRSRQVVGGPKMDMMRLLRGEPLETLSRELGVGRRLAAGDDFLEGGRRR